MDLRAEKDRLRGELRRGLGSLSEAARSEGSRRIAERVLDLPELREPRGLLCCLSFGDEPDTWGLLERLGAAEHRLHVPRARAADTSLHVHPWPCDLVSLDFGLRQPPAGTVELDSEEIDASVRYALVLGLGFDRRGGRLGYGRGYFDRFFARHRITAIGLAFDEQVVSRLPVEAHDRAMALVVTPSELIRSEP